MKWDGDTTDKMLYVPMYHKSDRDRAFAGALTVSFGAAAGVSCAVGAAVLSVYVPPQDIGVLWLAAVLSGGSAGVLGHDIKGKWQEFNRIHQEYKKDKARGFVR